MKKIRAVYITVLVFVILGVVAFYGLLQLRELRVWPFNSGLSKILPSSFKKFAYNATSPDQKVVASFLHNIKIEYFNIPDPGAVGGGGAINNIADDKLLVTLNNGQSLLFNEAKKQFNTVDSGDIKKIFSSVRDVFALEHKGEKYLAFLGTTKQSEKCKRISIYLLKYNLSDNGLNFLFSTPRKLWETEDACNEPVDNNAGGRIVFKDDLFYLSTGFFMGGGNLGDTPNFAQMSGSSFGKIITIDWQGRSEIISVGHRNPQGLFFAKSGSVLFSTEHAMRGGDELNIIRKKANYGFPCRSYGTSYSYDFSAPQKIAQVIDPKNICINQKFEDPNFYWSEKTGISQGVEYHGKEFSAFDGNLIISSLVGTSLFRIQIGETNNVMFTEKIDLRERLRDLNVSRSGKIMALTDGGNLLILSSAN
jgi:hypothetical protein